MCQIVNTEQHALSRYGSDKHTPFDDGSQ